MSDKVDGEVSPVSLSGPASAVFEKIFSVLRDDPDHRFFPHGINYVSLTIDVGPAKLSLTVSSESMTPAPPSHGGQWGIESLVRPMIVYAPPDGDIVQLLVTTPIGKGANAVPVDLTGNEWDLFDLDDAKKTTFVLPPPKTVPNAMQVIVCFPEASSRKSATFVGVLQGGQQVKIAKPVGDGDFYLLDFEKKDATIANPF